MRLYTNVVHSMLALSLFGCDQGRAPCGPDPAPDQTDGRITIVNDEGRLAERVSIRDDVVPVGSGMGKGDAAQAFSLRLVAEVQPPTVQGERLQATSVTFRGNFAYVSYNMRGSSAVGGIDVLQIRGVKNPTLKSSATFTDTDVSSVSYADNQVFLAEATSNPLYDAPAFAEVIATDGSDKLNLAHHFRRMLSSYVATSAVAVSGAVFVTTGNTGGLYRLGQLDSLPIMQFVQLDDARWVDIDESFVVVLQGTPGRLTVFDRTSLAPVRTISFDGANIAESKSALRLIGGKAVVAAGDGGVKVINLATGTILGSIGRTVVAGLDPAVTVTNAVDCAGTYLYISNGEAGIYVATASSDLIQSTGDTPIALTVLGKLQFATLQSANHVAFDGSTLAVAAGLGGTKLVSVTY